MDYLVEWSKFDHKAGHGYWEGRWKGRLFYITQSPERFYTVQEHGYGLLGTSRAWDKFNTLQEVKQWVDDLVVMEEVLLERASLAGHGATAVG